MGGKLRSLRILGQAILPQKIAVLLVINQCFLAVVGIQGMLQMNPQAAQRPQLHNNSNSTCCSDVNSSSNSSSNNNRGSIGNKSGKASANNNNISNSSSNSSNPSNT